MKSSTGARFSAKLDRVPSLPPGDPAPPEGECWCWLGHVAATPSFLPFLTLSGQIEAVARHRGAWGPTTARRIEAILIELSDPIPGGRPELLALADLHPDRWEDRPDVAWRVALAQELVTIDENDGTAENRCLLVALRLRRGHGLGWPGQIREHVGRFLEAWSRRTGRVKMLVDDTAFARRFAEDPDTDQDQALGVGLDRTTQPPWTWAVWMIWKELRRWKSMLSREAVIAAAGLGFIGHAARPGRWASFDPNSAVALVLCLIAGFAWLDRIGARDAETVGSWFNTLGKWSDLRSTGGWIRVRASLFAFVTAIIAVLGAFLAVIVNGPLTPRPLDIVSDGLLASIAGWIIYHRLDDVGNLEILRWRKLDQADTSACHCSEDSFYT